MADEGIPFAAHHRICEALKLTSLFEISPALLRLQWDVVLTSFQD
jgi:hypothetical protein